MASDAAEFAWRIDPYPEADPAFPLGWRTSKPVVRTWPEADLDERLTRDLREVKPGQRIALGTEADPWPAEEPSRGRTRRLLLALARHADLDVAITTRSNRVVGAIEPMLALAERNRVGVSVVVPTLDRRLAEALEPGADRPDLRLKAISTLAAAGLPAGAIVSPVVPWVNDHPDALDALAAAVVGSGGRWLRAIARMPLPGELVDALPALERSLPDLVDRYRGAHARCPASPAAYARGLEELLERLRRSHGLFGDPGRGDPRARGDGPQLTLL